MGDFLWWSGFSWLQFLGLSRLQFSGFLVWCQWRRMMMKEGENVERVGQVLTPLACVPSPDLTEL